jgi:hypothetical protein
MNITTDDVIDFGCAINPHNATIDVASCSSSSSSASATSSSNPVTTSSSSSGADSGRGARESSVKMESWDQHDV